MTDFVVYNEKQKCVKNNIMKLDKFHLFQSKYDSRDHIYSTPPLKKITNVTSIDLRNLCSTIEDQENLGSCTGQAFAGIAEFLKKQQNINIEISRLFIYYNERLLRKTINYDSGATIRDGIKACSMYGCCSENLYPHIIKDFTKKPSEAAYLDGSKCKAVSYKSIKNFDDMKKALINKNPVIIGFIVYSSFNKINKTGIMSYPSTTKERVLGGHAVVIVGFNDNYLNTNKGYFICRNSWGVNWGDKGYFYMPYDVIKNRNMSFDFWIITSIT